MKYHNSILGAIGNTPLVRLNKIHSKDSPIILAKVESLNPGGSIKDRIGLAMIEDAERKGLLKPGYTIIEPTSGNTGAGLALVAAVKGYKMIFVLPDKMSQEKIKLLKSYGAEVVVTPTSVPYDSPENYIEVAKTIASNTPNSYIANQYANPVNPQQHYDTTGPEIWSQTDGKIDVLVAGMGTGGTITGISKYLKKMNPNVKIVGVDPQGSIYASHFKGITEDIKAETYKTEGIGEDFIPSTIDLSLVDEVITVNDHDAFLTTRDLVYKEGIHVGGSSGSAVYAALKISETMNNGVIVVILPDTGRNYISKIYSDDWMQDHGYIERGVVPIIAKSVLLTKSSFPHILSVLPSSSINDAVDLMRKFEVSQLPVLNDSVPIGSIKEKSILKKLMSNEYTLSSTVDQLMDEPFPLVNENDDISGSQDLISEKNAAIVMDDRKAIGIITPIDILNYLSGERSK